MSPRAFTDPLLRDAHVLRADDSVREAVRRLLDSGLPALPVVEEGRLVGLFGEREFITAVFPRYVDQLGYAGFVPHSLDDALERRQSSRLQPVSEHMNTEHVDLSGDFSHAAVAETFLHHRVLIVPVTEDGRVVGVITRSDFFRDLAERFLER